MYYVKGATEKVLEKCSTYLFNGFIRCCSCELTAPGQTLDLSPQIVMEINEACASMANQALRVVAFAQGSSLDNLT